MKCFDDVQQTDKQTHSYIYIYRWTKTEVERETFLSELDEDPNLSSSDA